MISIIIPAYNEENVIVRCLSAITKGSQPNEMEIIVACNGCKDKTAENARKYSTNVKVIEIEEASKIAALNAADKVANYYPRFYIDADVVLGFDAILKINNELLNSNALLASPIAYSDVSVSTYSVKSFYEIWQSLPYNKVMVGTGVYVLSEEGRKHFDKFPKVISDDGFVRAQFNVDERIAVDTATVTVYAPATFSDLIKVQTRSRVGIYELANLDFIPNSHDKKKFFAILKSLPISINLPYKIFIYVLVNIITRIRAKYFLRDTTLYKWERDDTTRGH